MISFSLDSQAWRLGKVAVAVIDAVLEQVSGQGTDGRLDGRSSLLTDLVAKLMSQGLHEFEQDEREALFGAIIGDEPED